MQVIKLMQSFKSRELVTELFAWRHYYWFLTDEGIEYLRVYLNLPSEIVPATLKKSTRPLEKDGGRPPRRDYGDRPPRREGGFGGDRRYCCFKLRGHHAMQAVSDVHTAETD